MAKELVISSNRHETKVAVLEDEQLVEIHFQRANEYSLAGSIHKGRVTRVLPGMQSAFVDIGLERDAFLYVSDFVEETEEYDRIPLTGPERAPGPERSAPPPQRPAPAPAARAEEAEPRDRRLRRSRRRRGRGQGFPETKYARVEETVRPRGAEEAAGPSEFAILPGESLAKYRDLLAEQAEETAGARQEPGSEPHEAQAPESAGDPDEGGPGGQAAEPVSDPSPGSEAESEELSWEAAESTTAEAGGEQAPDGEQQGPEEFQAEPAEGSESEEAAGQAEQEQEREGEAAPSLAAVQSEEAEAPAEQAAGQAEAGAEAAEQPAEREVEPARMPVSLTATLREQGLRYMHRPSRRMRRKMRGPHEAPERAAEQPAPERAEGQRPAERAERPPQPSITELLKEGQEVLVQIAKEPLGQKGARITSHIALPGRYVVYMPTVDHHGVSRKIASEEERIRLKRILHRRRNAMPGGFIVRTAGEGRSEEEIAADMQFLYNLWQEIRRKAETRSAPALIHHDLDLVSRTLRDQLTEEFKAIWTDNEEVYERVVRFVERFQPTLVSRVKMYTRPTPIFDAFNISQELEKALRPKVWLKSGGYIVINQTEALVAIDVNTGKFVGKSNRLEDTIFRTNTEAVKEIVRQVRLRDLGGIIVIDFIDMEDRKNRQRVMQALEEAMRADRAPYKILQFNDFGLVAITRKRVKQSLERALCSPCPYCEGAGYVKSVQTVIGEILQEAHRVAGALEGREAMLRVNPEVAKVLKSDKNDYLEELEEILGKPVLVSSDATMQQEKFDLV